MFANARGALLHCVLFELLCELDLLLVPALVDPQPVVSVHHGVMELCNALTFERGEALLFGVCTAA